MVFISTAQTYGHDAIPTFGSIADMNTTLFIVNGTDFHR